MKTTIPPAVLLLFLSTLNSLWGQNLPAKAPSEITNPNLAFQAKVSATSEYSDSYAAQFATDGQIANPKSGDSQQAWCIRGDKSNGKADFVFDWTKPVLVSEVVYYARTGASFLDEGFKDAEIYLDDNPKPVAKCTFAPIHGPQRIDFSPATVSKLTIRFLSGFGRPNPGASEIMVFAKPANDSDLHLACQKQNQSLESFADAGMPEEIVFCTRKPSYDAHWYANLGYYADNVCHLPFPMGSGGALMALNVKTGSVRTILEDPQGNIRDPQISYDAAKILFSYLPAGKKHFSLFEINLDGTNLRQITGLDEDKPLAIPAEVHSDTDPGWRMSAEKLNQRRDFAPPGWDDYEPAYLPDDSIVFCSTRAKRFVNCWLTQVGTLHRCDANGNNIQELSCNIEQDNTPWVLPNGQIIYMRWEYVDRSQVNYHHLWTMNPDGTRQMVFYGNQRPGTTMLGPKPIPGTNKIVCTFSPGHGMKEHYGTITVVDPRLGPDSPAGAKFISRNNSYSDPWSFDENHFMAASHNKIVLLDGKGNSWTLYQLPDSLSKQGFWINEPRPVMPRQRERIIADQTNPSENYGTLALANIYKGRKMQNVKPGTVKELLIYETLPKPIHYTGGTEMMSIFGTFTLERLVGTVPVSPEGSAYFKLPANRPFLFLAMDEKGHCIKRMHSFTSVMPGENTTCIGCHEQRTETPNADDRDRLFRLMRSQPDEVKPVDGVPGVLCFTRDIQPILDKYCLECHNPNREDGGVNLSGHWTPLYTISYAHLSWRNLFADNRNRAMSNFGPYEIGTGASRLVKLIEEKHQGVNMPESDQKIIRMWIDAGANFAGTYAASASGGVGYYMANIPVRNEKKWQETTDMQNAISRRCDPCHAPTPQARRIGQYDIYADNYSPRNPHEAKDQFVPHDLAEGNGRFSRLEVFDLSYPEQSKVLTAPLSVNAKGRGICQAKSGKPVFESVQDPDYQAILRGIQKGRKYILEEDNRFSMITPSANNGPDCPTRFVPRWAYLRELIRYGVLPVDADPNASYNPYELDQKYWESLWYKPVREDR